MLEVLVPGVTFWADISTMNVQSASTPGPEDHFAYVRAAQYRLRRPGVNRVVQRAPDPAARQIPGVVPTPIPPQTLGAGVWAVTDTSRGESNNEDRNFYWLPYWPGQITYTEILPRSTIFTGRMNGCLLVIFRYKGRRYFGHLGTVDNSHSVQTMQVKNAWKLATGRRLITLESQFNPSEFATTDITLGALSISGNFYAFDLQSAGSSQFKVMGRNLRIGDEKIPIGW